MTNRVQTKSTLKKLIILNLVPGTLEYLLVRTRERKIGYWSSGSDFLIEILEIINKMLLSSHTEVISLE